ncbi:MAG: hypothetical protein AAGC97_17700, partial [Planctomycetota bacterium]
IHDDQADGRDGPVVDRCIGRVGQQKHDRTLASGKRDNKLGLLYSSDAPGSLPPLAGRMLMADGAGHRLTQRTISSRSSVDGLVFVGWMAMVGNARSIEIRRDLN